MHMCVIWAEAKPQKSSNILIANYDVYDMI